MTNEREPPILRSEVEEAITYPKPNKAPGLDEASAKKIKLLGEEGIKIIQDINKVWRTGQWPGPNLSLSLSTKRDPHENAKIIAQYL